MLRTIKLLNPWKPRLLFETSMEVEKDKYKVGVYLL